MLIVIFTGVRSGSLASLRSRRWVSQRSWRKWSLDFGCGAKSRHRSITGELGETGAANGREPLGLPPCLFQPSSVCSNSRRQLSAVPVFKPLSFRRSIKRELMLHSHVARRDVAIGNGKLPFLHLTVHSAVLLLLSIAQGALLRARQTGSTPALDH